MMKFRHALAVLAFGAVVGTGCSCEPLVPNPNTGGGSGGGEMGGGGGSMGGGGGAMGGGGGGGPVQLTEYARNLIVTGTSDTAAARRGVEFLNLPDDAPITYSQGFFDGGTQ